MNNSSTLITGRFQSSGKGFGFLIPEGGTAKTDDYFVPPRDTAGAWDGDTVEAVPTGEDPRRPGRPCAKIKRIVKRGNELVTGVILKADRELWLRPDNERLPGLIKLSRGTRVRAGEKAAVAVTSYGSSLLPPLGVLKKTFGPAGSREASTEAILCQQGIEREFPDTVRVEAAAIRQRVPAAALRGRTDLRDKTVITIDGASSKDLDDAISLERQENGSWLLGVHIADVSHYVTPGSPLDEEAFHRGTSVYFADQVIPMLPVELSNGICSLNPGVDRLTLSCFMTMDKTGAILRHEIAPSVIRSKERMTYADCNALLSPDCPAGLTARYQDILPMLRDMAGLAKALEKRRRNRGGLELESRESYILCDEKGSPVEVVSRSQGVSEKLIEDFMLAANETVAQHLFDLKKPAVYRVHEKPSLEKTENLKAMLAPLGLSLKQADNHSLQKVLDAVKDKPEAPAVSMMVLRSLMKARYAPENLGHFGLAAPYYCHFTSPIRRYPDLMIHRCLHALWDKGEQNAPRERKRRSACDRAAAQASQREVAAQTAERDIEKLYFAEYMHAHIGEHFPAAVSGVTRFGLFAALPSGVEGLIPVETLPDDHYVYDEKRMTLAGERTGQVWSFGMTLEVVCVAADPGTGRVDFRLPGREEAPAREKDALLKVPVRRNAQGKAPGKSRGNRRAMHVPKGRRKGKRR